MAICFWGPLALLLVPSVRAGGYSIDVELLEPMVSHGDLPGLDGAHALATGSARAALLYQYVSEPVTLRSDGDPFGAPVAARATVFMAGSADVGEWLTARAVLPAVVQAGDGSTGLEANGYGMGDLRLGARALRPGHDAWAAGLDLELYVPVGTHYAWLGEEAPRLRVGAVSRGTMQWLTLLGDAGVIVRRGEDTGLDLVSSSELYVNAGARVTRDRVEIYGVGLSQLALAPGMSSEARAALEVLGGLQVHATRWARVTAGVGHGLTQAVGASAWRLMLGLTLERRVEKPAPQPQGSDPLARADELLDGPPAVRVTPLEPVEEAPEPVWEEGALARVRLETASIEIREPIQFEFGTDRILPVSLPTLHAVAEILSEHPEIEALVIEGHASEEGSYLYNYDLAYRRCGAVFRELVSAGVHPYRLSTRSMGEVVPKGAGQDEASLALNRRVEFRIVRQRHPLEPGAPLAPVSQPWDGGPLSAPPEETP